MGRFASTASLYARARPPYGTTFFGAVADRLGLSGRERLLDLGTGPGTLALGFAPFVAEAVAVDPEATMVEAARRATDGRRIRVIEATAEALPDDLGAFDVVTIGRALHWMDPAGLRATLASTLAASGAVVVCGARSAEDGVNPWLSAYEGVRRRWSGGAGHVRADDAAIFAGTGLDRRDRLATRFRHAVAIEDLCDRVLSMSSSSPERIGAAVPAMRAALAAALAPFAPQGWIEEEIEARAEILQAG